MNNDIQHLAFVYSSSKLNLLLSNWVSKFKSGVDWGKITGRINSNRVGTKHLPLFRY